MLNLWSVFDDVMRFEPWSWSAPDMSQGVRFSPALDVTEGEDAWLINVELPGVKPEDVNLEREANVLTISGHKAFEVTGDSRGYRFNERRYGEFARSITLPSTVNADAIEANMQNGVLTIRLPKAEQARPRHIPIQVVAPQLEQGAPAQIAEGQPASAPAVAES